MPNQSQMGLSRRQLLSLMGVMGGSAALLQTMTSMGYAQTSPYTKPINLQGAPKGASVIVLGAGLAGMTAAMELRKAGYKVKVLEYNNRVGGRSWTIRGGDRFTELGGETQVCEFAPGQYFNPGPWRVSPQHRAILDYCRRLNVPLEPFIEVNYNGYLHSTKLFGGKPQRQHHVVPDFHGSIAELLAKATQQEKLDDPVTKEDGKLLLEVLRDWAGLNREFRYTKGPESSKMRGFQSFDRSTGVGTPTEPLKFADVLRLFKDADFWAISNHSGHRDLHNPLFQPVGGMDMLAKAMEKQLPGLIEFNAKVTAVHQDAKGVTVRYEKTNAPGQVREAKADWCVCTIPLSILGQIDIQVGAPMLSAISAIAYSTSVKVGLQFKRRFWEEDDAIYGGFSHTDLPIRTLAYPSYGFNRSGPGVMYGAFMFGAYSFEFAGLSAKERVQKALEYGAQIHPQYRTEFQNGVSVAWHRQPFSLGCFARWTDALAQQHLGNLREIDGRIGLAGEALAKGFGGWQEGAILSSLDLIERLHKRAVSA
jgi:monoamine oxidase